MPLMRAVQIASPGADFQLVKKEIPEPRAHEIRIRVEACGVCRGDTLVKEGHFPGLQYPRVPGHEVVGLIDRCGTNLVSDWEVGQRVGVGWYGGPCLKCSACRRGDLGRGQNIMATGISFDGGYAEYMVAPMQAFVKIPSEITPTEAAPLLCAGRTTFEAVRSSGARGGDLVAVLGLGGLGHLAIQFARKFGCRTVALSRGREKEQLAYQLGAHLYVDTEAAQPGEELRKLGGARVILATAPSGRAISDVINGLGNDGQLYLLAMQNEPIQVSPLQLARGGRSIRGSMGRFVSGSVEDTLSFSVLSGIRPMVETFSLDQASEAYEKMMSARVHFRSVLVPGMSPAGG